MTCFQVEKRKRDHKLNPSCEGCKNDGSTGKSATYWFWILDRERIPLCEKCVKEWEHIYIGCFEVMTDAR